MDDNSRNDIRKLLKAFGIRADEALVAHLARNPDVSALRLRLTLEDLTEYETGAPAMPLHVEIEDIVRR